MVPIPAPVHPLLDNSHRGSELVVPLRNHPAALAPLGPIFGPWKASAMALYDVTLRVPHLAEHGFPLLDQLLLHRPVQLQAGEGPVQPESGRLPVPADHCRGAGQSWRTALQCVFPDGHARDGHHVHMVPVEQGCDGNLLVRHTVQGHVPTLGAGWFRVHLQIVSSG